MTYLNQLVKPIKNYLFICFLLSITISGNAQTELHRQYIDKFYPIAVAEMERAGIPASIKLAQGILESGVGKSELATNANNHFGIKCGSSWVGEEYYLKDDDKDASGKLIKSCFRVFDSAEESFIAHTEFLQDPKKEFRYGPLFKFSNTDYRSWAYGLKDAGYATNPKYPDLLLSIIKNNNLDQYDKLTMADLDADFVENYPEQRDELANRKYTKVTMFNNLKSVFAKEGETPSDIGVKFNIPTRLIVKYNEIDGIKIFEENERLFLQNKRTKYKGNTKTHRVQKGESIYKIGQKYGVKTQWLYWRNRMKPNTEPAPGEQLKLKGWNFKGVKTLPSGTKHETKPTPTTPKTNNQPNEDDGYLEEITPPSAKKITHIVEKGETLYGIARKYGVPVEEIKKLNNLKSNTLTLGQELIIK